MSIVNRSWCMSFLLAVATVAALLMTSSASAQVYRCGNNYSSSPCHGGQAIDTSPAVRDQRSIAATTIYLCKSYDGGLFWARDYCGTQNALVERMESVPLNMPWEQQVEMANNRLNKGRPPSTFPVRPSRREQTEPTNASQCYALDDRIQYLDQLARAGGDAAYMDWVANERKLTRDRQFRIRC